MRFEELLKEIEELQRKIMEETLEDMEGLSERLDDEELKGNWFIEPFNGHGARGFIARGFFRTPEAPESLESSPLLNPLNDNPREPLYDLKESEDDVQLYIELPGVEKEEIKLSFDGASVKLDAGKFNAVIDLPRCVFSTGSVQTDFRNGIFTVTIPKAKGTEI